MTRESVERSMQLAGAEIQAAKGRQARHAHIVAMAASHGVEIGAIPIDDELAVTRAVARLEAWGVPLDQALINPPTAAQILAGHDERREP